MIKVKQILEQKVSLIRLKRKPNRLKSKRRKRICDDSRSEILEEKWQEKEYEI